MTVWIAAGGVTCCVVVLIFSKAARRHVWSGWTAFNDAETKRSERALVALGVLLILSGGIIPGPLDELLGVALIGRVVKRVAARKAAG